MKDIICAQEHATGHAIRGTLTGVEVGIAEKKPQQSVQFLHVVGTTGMMLQAELAREQCQPVQIPCKAKHCTEELREPYSVLDVIDDKLVKVLLDPLLTPGADNVVFNTLSYSTGPLPENHLGGGNFLVDCPVWWCKGRIIHGRLAGG